MIWWRCWSAVGPAIVLTHSRSGPFGWLVADARPDLVRAILAIEPNGPPFFDVVPSAVTPTFVRAWGIAYAKLHFDPSVEQPASLAPGLDASDDGPDMERCWLPTGAKRTLPGLQRMPILILSSEASYHARYDQCTVRFLMRNGVQPDFVRLADIGIHGNGHMMMIEKNNEQVAKVLLTSRQVRRHSYYASQSRCYARGMKRDGRGFDHRTLEAIRLMAVERVQGERPSSVVKLVRLSSHDDLQMAQGGVTPWSGTESTARQAGNEATTQLERRGRSNRCFAG